MRSEHDFLDALRESPDDDELRLVFSDWLEDQDDGRADLLRLQVERRRLAPDDPAQAGLVGRQHDLLRRAMHGWLAPLRPYNVSLLRGNGLLAVAMPEGHLRALDADQLRQPPWHWVDGLRLYGLSDEFAATFAAAALGHFRHLDLSANHLHLDGLRGLAAASHLARLTTLDLEKVNLPWDGGGLLGSAAWLPQLRGLNLAQNPLGNVGLHALVVHGRFDRLRVLELRGCEVGPLGVAVLVAARFFGQLDALGLADNGLDNDAGKALAASPHVGRLKLLDLRGNAIQGRVATRLRQRCPGLLL